ncbi:hypothetical protein UA32_11835 [Photobacterium angustum]|uniref:Uncharacterized protein n=1 Tax=Photobacterium angustum TaxID=661 RepID=A0ABX5H1Z3_PHOAN|nr:hypothetical protein [Photobacterium angustum]KJG37650.1 hypothetical protein UA32_11835 [Photobacterium angustum]PSX07107.1 hypothetical protein C0W27_16180 [Photobacterium angustum]
MTQLKPIKLNQLPVFNTYSSHRALYNFSEFYDLRKPKILNHIYDHLEHIDISQKAFTWITEKFTNSHTSHLLLSKIMEWLAYKSATKLQSSYYQNQLFKNNLRLSICTDFTNSESIEPSVFNSLDSQSVRLTSHDFYLCMIDTKNLSQQFEMLIQLLTLSFANSGCITVIGSSALSMSPIHDIYPYSDDFTTVEFDSLESILKHHSICGQNFADVDCIDLMMCVDDVFYNNENSVLESVNGQIISSADIIEYDPFNEKIEIGLLFAENYCIMERLNYGYSITDFNESLSHTLSLIEEYCPQNTTEKEIQNLIQKYQLNVLTKHNLEYDEEDIATAFTVVFSDQKPVNVDEVFYEKVMDHNITFNGFPSAICADKFLSDLSLISSFLSELEYITNNN